MSKLDLVLEDFIKEIDENKIENKYIKMYKENYSEDYVKIFSYYNQSLNELFSFMNSKNESNKHYNAEPSRELIHIINNIYELKESIIKYGGEKIILCKEYQKIIDEVSQFLKPSGGSPIPNDFKKINIIKYDPVFYISNKKIEIFDYNNNIDLKNIGEGAFSIVSKYKDKNYNRFFAVKTLKKDVNEREKERFKKEFDILENLNFPYILDVYSYDNMKNQYIMEYCNSTLKTYINKNNNKLTFDTRKRIVLQFLYAINYIHSKEILHRDISYNNILIKEFDNSIMIKLSDFGLVKTKLSDFTNTDTEIKGTKLDPTLNSFKEYNKKNEIYSIGFIIYFIFTGKQGYESEDNNICTIIDKCINSNLSKRYNNVLDIIKDIELYNN